MHPRAAYTRTRPRRPWLRFAEQLRSQRRPPCCAAPRCGCSAPRVFRCGLVLLALPQLLPPPPPPRTSSNRVLGDRHRVAITQFTLLQQNGKPKNEPPFGSVDECFAWVRAHGYDGLEIGVDDLRSSFMPRASYPEIVAAYRKAAAANSTPCLGVLYHITDYPGGFASTVKGGGSHPNVGPQDLDLNDPTFWSALRERLSYDKQCGAEYITFQINRELRSPPPTSPLSHLLTGDARSAGSASAVPQHGWHVSRRRAVPAPHRTGHRQAPGGLLRAGPQLLRTRSSSLPLFLGCARQLSWLGLEVSSEPQKTRCGTGRDAYGPRVRGSRGVCEGDGVLPGLLRDQRRHQPLQLPRHHSGLLVPIPPPRPFPSSLPEARRIFREAA